MYHTEMLESKSLPGVEDGGVEMLLPVIACGEFLAEGEMKQCKEIDKLIICLVDFGLSVNL